MIDDFNTSRTGWARFSDDRVMRYRLARALSERAVAVNQHPTGDPTEVKIGWLVGPLKRVVFLLLNPSTADAFELDPTVTECRKRSINLGADVLEVVNLFAFRSPYPTDLRKRAVGFRGDDPENNATILAACTGAHCVIAGWGNDGALDHRDLSVLNLLRSNRTALHHLGTTQGGYPKHPLARGKHRIPADQQPIAWSPS